MLFSSFMPPIGQLIFIFYRFGNIFFLWKKTSHTHSNSHSLITAVAIFDPCNDKNKLHFVLYSFIFIFCINILNQNIYGA
jgi:hypothetical protein